MLALVGFSTASLGVKMKFSDLLNQPYCARTGIIDLEPLKLVLPNTPDEVIKQVYSDHGRKFEFQKQYEEINISEIKWELKEYRAEEIVVCATHKRFSNWVNNVKKRVANFHKNGWECIDSREFVIEHWAQNGTWIKPPIFIAGKLVGLTTELRLVEGHTRVGLLKGLLDHHVIESESVHHVWLGSDKNA